MIMSLESDDSNLIRIAIICGSLEPGRDGVGDYTSTLATALRKLGVTVALLALSDRHISVPLAPDNNTLRLPTKMPVTERYRLAKDAIERWAPDWISLQFVSWDFGWKGILGEQSRLLVELTRRSSLHIMFHETWIGDGPEFIPRRISRIKRFILGRLQKLSIAIFVRKARPSLINTSNKIYQRQLAQIGVTASQLIMFGSIQLATDASWDHFTRLVSEKAGLTLPQDRSTAILVGVFGAIRQCPIEATLRSIFASAKGRRVIIICLGVAGPHAPSIVNEWKISVPGIEIVMLGPLSPNDLSVSFQQLDGALSLHLASVIGKSSAAAALLEHGVPIICPWGEIPQTDDIFSETWRGMITSSPPAVIYRFEKLNSGKSKSNKAETAARQLLLNIAQADGLQ